MRKRYLNLILIAALLIATIAVGQAFAYFTTYTEAKGGKTIQLGFKTEITEDYDDFVKTLVIKNNKDSKEEVYVRAKAYTDSSVTVTYSDSDGKWNPGADEFYYYSDPVPVGGETSALTVTIKNVPENPEEGDSFNVIVIYESCAVRYKEDGTPYADWDVILDVHEETQEVNANG